MSEGNEDRRGWILDVIKSLFRVLSAPGKALEHPMISGVVVLDMAIGEHPVSNQC